jgi:hypothetical protein
MDKAELKKRAELADERVINLFKRYPLVGIIVSTVGMLIGIGICNWDMQVILFLEFLLIFSI